MAIQTLENNQNESSIEKNMLNEDNADQSLQSEKPEQKNEHSPRGKKSNTSNLKGFIFASLYISMLCFIAQYLYLLDEFYVSIIALFITVPFVLFQLYAIRIHKTIVARGFSKQGSLTDRFLSSINLATLFTLVWGLISNHNTIIEFCMFSIRDYFYIYGLIMLQFTFMCFPIINIKSQFKDFATRYVSIQTAKWLAIAFIACSFIIVEYFFPSTEYYSSMAEALEASWEDIEIPKSTLLYFLMELNIWIDALKMYTLSVFHGIAEISIFESTFDMSIILFFKFLFLLNISQITSLFYLNNSQISTIFKKSEKKQDKSESHLEKNIADSNKSSEHDPRNKKWDMTITKNIVRSFFYILNLSLVFIYFYGAISANNYLENNKKEIQFIEERATTFIDETFSAEKINSQFYKIGTVKSIESLMKDYTYETKLLEMEMLTKLDGVFLEMEKNIDSFLITYYDTLETNTNSKKEFTEEDKRMFEESFKKELIKHLTDLPNSTIFEIQNLQSRYHELDSTLKDNLNELQLINKLDFLQKDLRSSVNISKNLFIPDNVINIYEKIAEKIDIKFETNKDIINIIADKIGNTAIDNALFPIEIIKSASFIYTCIKWVIIIVWCVILLALCIIILPVGIIAILISIGAWIAYYFGIIEIPIFGMYETFNQYTMEVQLSPDELKKALIELIIQTKKSLY